ncbi:hypothetical protein WJX82_007293 [Trebouxia sp. C0006]
MLEDRPVTASGGLCAARLTDQKEVAAVLQDVTTDADVIEKVLTPLEHRINKVIIKQQDEVEAAYRKHKAQFVEAAMDALIILGNEFKEDFWPKLCSPEKAQTVMDALQTQQQQIAQDFEAGCAELSLLESHVLEPAYDDPGMQDQQAIAGILSLSRQGRLKATKRQRMPPCKRASNFTGSTCKMRCP